MNSSELFSFSNFCLYRLWLELPSMPHLQIRDSFVHFCSVLQILITLSAVLDIIHFKSTSAEISVVAIGGKNFNFYFLTHIMMANSLDEAH